MTVWQTKLAKILNHVKKNTMQRLTCLSALIVIPVVLGMCSVFAVGCAATTKPSIVVAVDPSGIWPAQPLASLAKAVSSLYLPAYRLDGIPLASVLWRPQLESIPAGLKLSNEALNDSHWYVEMVFGSTANDIWLYQGEGLAGIEELSSTLKNFAPSGEQIRLTLNQNEPQTVPIQNSADGGASAISLEVSGIDLVVIWQRVSVQEIEAFVNSLTPASKSGELVTSLEREW